MYEEIDKILLPWSKKYGLHVFTEYKESEIRSLNVVDDSGDTYQIIISPIDDAQEVYIHFGIRKSKRVESKSASIKASLFNLENSLEKTYKQITSWIKEFGHTRTPVL